MLRIRRCCGSATVAGGMPEPRWAVRCSATTQRPAVVSAAGGDAPSGCCGAACQNQGLVMRAAELVMTSVTGSRGNDLGVGHGHCGKAEGACGGAPESVPLSRMATGQCGCSCSRIEHAGQGQSKQALPMSHDVVRRGPTLRPGLRDRERCCRARLNPHTNPNRTQNRRRRSYHSAIVNQ